MFLNPLFFVALITVVFNFVLGARFAGGVDEGDYTSYILAGLVPWQVFSISLSRGPAEVLGSANLVKQVVFPIDTLPVKGVLSVTPPLIVGLMFLIVYQLIAFGHLAWTWFLVPVLVLFQLAWMIGCSLLLSSIAVFFRDLKDVITMFVMAGIYLLPIVYVPDAVPDPLKVVVKINPFSNLVYCYQDAIFFGRFEHPWSWLFLVIVAPVSLLIGHRIFERLRPHMGNVL